MSVLDQTMVGICDDKYTAIIVFLSVDKERWHEMFAVFLTVSFQLFVTNGRGINTPTSCVRQWAITGACSVLCYFSGGLVFCLHIITCFCLVMFITAAAATMK